MTNYIHFYDRIKSLNVLSIGAKDFKQAVVEENKPFSVHRIASRFSR
jgi:hypothetical protein